MAFQVRNESAGKQNGNDSQGLEDKMPIVWAIPPSDAYPKATGHQKEKQAMRTKLSIKVQF